MNLILDEYTEAMYDLCANEWLEAVKKGDVEKEQRYSDYLDLCEWALSKYEAEAAVNNQMWKTDMP